MFPPSALGSSVGLASTSCPSSLHASSTHPALFFKPAQQSHVAYYLPRMASFFFFSFFFLISNFVFISFIYLFLIVSSLNSETQAF
jgi:hypothetical protein